MQTTRRSFLAAACSRGAALAAGPATFSAFLAASQTQSPQAQDSGPIRDSDHRSNDDDIALRPSATKAVLEDNEKNIKKNVEKLFQLATELKEEVEKTNSSKVLSLSMVRKAEEIEKLAKNIKARAKG